MSLLLARIGAAGATLQGIIHSQARAQADRTAAFAATGIVHTQVMLRAPGGKIMPGVIHAQARLQVQGGYAIPGRITAMAKLQAPGGKTLPGVIHAQARLQAPGGVATPGRITTMAKLRAPGGETLPGVIHTQARAQVQSGFALPGVIHTQARAQPGPRATTALTTVLHVQSQSLPVLNTGASPSVLLSGTACIIIGGQGFPHMVRVVPGTRLPLYLQGDGTYWKGRQ